MKLNIVLGKIIKDFRKAQSLTQGECAKKLRVTQAKWSSYELGKTEIAMRTLFAMCKVMDIHPVVFICQFLSEAFKARKFKKMTFNQYMKIIDFAPKVCEK